MKRTKYEPYVRPIDNTELLSETVWVGTELQKNTFMCAEGMVIKTIPNILVKLNGIEEPVTVTIKEIWIRNPNGRKGRPLR
tara:strand:- start:1858 stop:2100 length:243 start_codon:yes stop_codon:yes gene_type:complete